MSHFNVAIITEWKPTQKEIEKALAPYQENNCGDCPQEFLVFHSLTEEYKDVYENNTREMIQLPDGALVNEWEDILYRQISQDEYEKLKDESAPGYVRERWDSQSNSYKYYIQDLEKVGGVRVDIPIKDLYSSLAEFLIAEKDAEYDRDKKDFGYWENPNAKWDYWAIGGRWSQLLTVPDNCMTCDTESFPDEHSGYKRVNSARINDIKFLDKEEKYKKAIRFWEMKVEGVPPETKKEEEEIKYDFFTPQYYVRKYGTKENFAECESTFYTYAFITKDGVWHSLGEMGWFGMSYDEDDIAAYIKGYQQEVFEKAAPEDFLTIVDCHI